MGLYDLGSSLDEQWAKKDELTDTEFKGLLKQLKQYLTFCKVGMDRGSDDARVGYELASMMLEDLQTPSVLRFIKAIEDKKTSYKGLEKFLPMFKMFVIKFINNPDVETVKIRTRFYDAVRQNYQEFYVDYLMKYNETYKAELEREDDIINKLF